MNSFPSSRKASPGFLLVLVLMAVGVSLLPTLLSSLDWTDAGKTREIRIWSLPILVLYGLFKLVMGAMFFGYAAAKAGPVVRGLIYLLALGTVMLPIKLVADLVNQWGGWIHLPLGPGWLGFGASIFFLAGYFQRLDGELEDAARLEGCGDWDFFFKVVLPKSQDALLLVTLFTAAMIWRDFLLLVPYLIPKTNLPFAYWQALGFLPVFLAFFAARKAAGRAVAQVLGR